MALLLHLWAQYASFWILAQMVQTAWAHHHCWPIFEVYDNSCNKQTNKQTNKRPKQFPAGPGDKINTNRSSGGISAVGKALTVRANLELLNCCAF